MAASTGLSGRQGIERERERDLYIYIYVTCRDYTPKTWNAKRPCKD